MNVALLDWGWVAANGDAISSRLVEHLVLTALALLYGCAIAFPLALAALRWPRLYSPLLGLTGALFTVPSLALFVLLIPLTGLSRTTAVIGLTLYTLLILLRNAVEGLRGVPRDVREAAEAMGYRRVRLLLSVEVPLALPVIVAGLRIAAVTTIALVSVTAVIGQGGLGQLMLLGFSRFFPTPLVVGVVLSMALALGADLVLLVLQRRLSPWARGQATA